MCSHQFMNGRECIYSNRNKSKMGKGTLFFWFSKLIVERHITSRYATLLLCWRWWCNCVWRIHYSLLEFKLSLFRLVAPHTLSLAYRPTY